MTFLTHTIFRRVIVGVIVAGFFTVIPLVGYSIADAWERYYLETTPREEFFNYISTTASQKAFELSQEIQMKSVMEVYKPVHFYWNDRLWCDYDNDEIGYHLIGRHVDDLDSPPVIRGVDDPSKWTYTGRLPQDTGDCYIISHIEADVGQGVLKSQTITSGPFDIIQP